MAGETERPSGLGSGCSIGTVFRYGTTSRLCFEGGLYGDPVSYTHLDVYKRQLDGMDTTVITEMAEYYEKEIGYKLPSRTPFVGKNFNVTRAGIHADGLLKNEEIYNIFDTEKFLNRPVMVAVSNTSGLAGIAHWINTYFRLKGDKCVTKSDPLIRYVKEWVDKEYESGRVTSLTDEELLKVIDEGCKACNYTIGA